MNDFVSKYELCRKVFTLWVHKYLHDKDMNEHDDEIFDVLFTAKMIKKKFDAFCIDIVLPDYLIMLIDICIDSNPGLFQVVLKEILVNARSDGKPLPSKYVITPYDYLTTFDYKHPIIEIAEYKHKFEDLWDAQKVVEDAHPTSRNKCDTKRWWLEAIKGKEE
jgi:hypothetical protein